MSNVLETSGPGFFGSRWIFRLLASGSDLSATEESLTGAADASAVLVEGEVQRSFRGSFLAVDRDPDPERVDAVAGSEFVDDRIRIRE